MFSIGKANSKLDLRDLNITHSLAYNVAPIRSLCVQLWCSRLFSIRGLHPAAAAAAAVLSRFTATTPIILCLYRSFSVSIDESSPRAVSLSKKYYFGGEKMHMIGFLSHRLNGRMPQSTPYWRRCVKACMALAMFADNSPKRGLPLQK